MKSIKVGLSFNDLSNEFEDLISKININSLKKARWFQQKSAQIREIEIIDYTELLIEEDVLLFPTILDFNLQNSVNHQMFNERYYIPILISKENKTDNLLLKIEGRDYRAYLCDGINNLLYVQKMDDFMKDNSELKMKHGGRLIGKDLGQSTIYSARKLTAVSSNSITLTKKDEIVKTFRRLNEGINPDLEISLNLQKKTEFNHFPEVRRYSVYRDIKGREYNINLVQEFVDNEGDCWAYTQRHLEKFLNYIIDNNQKDLKALVKEYSINYKEMAGELGRTIARLHLALSSIEFEDFKPTLPDKDELKQWIEEMKENLYTLSGYLQEKKDDELSDHKGLINKLISQEDIDVIIEDMLSLNDLGKFIRCHGDLHLEQILKSGNEFIILDFEGEPLKSIVERRKRLSPLKDIAGMIRSYNYATYAGYFNFIDDNNLVNKERLINAINFWEEEIIDVFLSNYLELARSKGDFLPEEDSFVKAIAIFKLDKALYEALYEVNNRPDWLPIPLKGIIDCLEELK